MTFMIAALAGLAVGAVVYAAQGPGLAPARGALVLERLARPRRAKLIARSLPDTLDLITASVEAGLGLDAAIALTIRRPPPGSRALADLLARYLHDVRHGTARREALRTLAERSGCDDLRHVVSALVQGDTLGVGVARILRGQALHLRQRRRQRAEEQAAKAPVKLIFPLLFGIFPAIFVVVLGPAALTIYDVFK